MSDDEIRTLLKRVTTELLDTRARLGATERARHEPIAIVGMACRFPGGVDTPEGLWDLVAAGRDAVGPFPADRGWDVEGLYDPDPDRSGRTYTRHGGFLDDVAGFDAPFFRIGAREALAMDPQHRLLLETAWHAFEHAGIDPGGLRGANVAVYAGTNGQDYAARLPETPAAVDGYVALGNAASVASGRVAYFLGFEGPAVTVDTACSSSLVALHLAVNALRSGQTDLALAGGVTVLSSPVNFVEFSRQRGLSADGRCRAFADGADGTGWAEGVGWLLVERLSDARRHGHRVLATVRGTAVNQDGASNGLTAPNGSAQQRVIREALADAQLAAADVDLLEAHGTGTRLGDPIEAQALLETYGRGRDADRPLWLGSVKSNIGHTQAAAGVAGIIKAVGALRNEVLPRTLYVEEPSTLVDWSSGAVRLLRREQAWPAAEGRPRRAGVSAFGVSGTNAHVIVEEAPDATDVDVSPAGLLPVPGPVLVPLSADSAEALAEQARRVAATVRPHTDTAPNTNMNTNTDLADLGYSLATARAALRERAVVLADGPDALVEALAALGSGEPSASVLRGTAAAPGGVAFMFSGQGSQRPGMGRELYEAFPAFAEAFDRAAEALDEALARIRPGYDRKLRDVVFETGLVHQTLYTQPALFALQTALAALLGSFGVTADHLIGHSLGEITAAHHAGVLSLDDAATLVAARAHLMDSLPSGGGMTAIEAPEDEVRPLLTADVDIAAVNTPGSTVVSGAASAVEALAGVFAERGVKTRALKVSHAFHSPLMDPVLEEFRAVAESLTYHRPTIPLVSNVTGAVAEPARHTDPEYWVRHIRESVRFADGVAALAGTGARTFVELGPDSTLTTLAAAVVADSRPVPVLRRKQGETASAVAAVGELFVRGVPIVWDAVFDGPRRRRVELPLYPFQHTRFWLDRPAMRTLGGLDHPLLETATQLADSGGLVLMGTLDPRVQTWLADHVVGGAVVVPGTAFVELALRAGDEVAAEVGLVEELVVEELVVEAPLVLAEGTAARVQVALAEADAEGRRALTVHAQVGEGGWIRHASGVLTAGSTSAGDDLTVWPPADAVPVDVSEFYAVLAESGLGYGPAFQGVRQAWRGGDDLFAEVVLPGAADSFGLHPALLDAALHPAAFHHLPDTPAGHSLLPFVWRGVRLHASGADALRVRLTLQGPESLALFAADPTGTPVVSVESLRSRPVALGTVAPVNKDLYTLRWQAADPAGSAPVDDPWIVVDTADHAAVAGDDPVGRTAQVLEALQTLAADERSRILVVTRGAVAVRDGESPDPATAPVWGLVRSAQAERPGRTVLLDLDPADAGSSLIAPPEEVFGVAAAGESQVALRDGGVWVPRLVAAGAVVRKTWDPAGTVLITGGTGALGGALAAHLVAEHGVRHLLLVSRRGIEAPGAHELATELSGLGAESVEIVAADVADSTEVGAVLSAIPADRRLSAVIHTAGVADDAALDALTGARIEAVFRPKADAARVLDEATAGLELDAFVLFSSVAGVVGSAGQANYAAANVALDALAARRRARGQAALSLAWGLWRNDGDRRVSALTGHLSAADLARAARSGVRALSTAEGLRLFDAALGLDSATAVPCALDLDAVRATAESTAAAGQPATGTGTGTGRFEIPPLFRALVQARPAAPRRSAAGHGTASDVPRHTTGLAARLAEAPAADRAALLLTLVRDQTASVLATTASAIPARRPFTDLGLDSLTSLELRDRLGAATGVRLPATLTFDHPTPAAVAAHLLDLLQPASAAALATEPGRVTDSANAPAAKTPAEDPIVIVGMACRLPGGVASPDDLWRLVSQGVDAVSDFPADRGWDVEALYDPDPDAPGRTYTRSGGFLHDAADFDANFFGIAPREALAADPQQRLLLETAWEAFEHAGIDPTTLRGSRTGVFAGMMYHDYAPRVQTIPTSVEGYLANGSAGSIASGRISYTFGFEGPAVTVDTACSSSLVALHLASQSLRTGECDLALAGGVAVMSSPQVFTEYSRQKGISADGRSKAFAAAADGVGWAEGVGLLLVERLSDARRLGHEVLAVVRGSAVNQDGASNGLTAPNGPAQQRVIRAALAASGLEAGDVDAVEAHGTGTTLGDPIEAQALLAVYGAGRAGDQPLWLGSLKSNIGHAQAAAGAAGVIKMVQALRHGVLPRTLHVDEPTPHVDWSAGAVRLLTEQRVWPETGRPRRAGVSSFGVSGTNAHVILERLDAASPDDPGVTATDSAPEVPLPWLLSGRSTAALRGQAARLAEGIPEDATPEAIADFGFSLATSRAAFEERAVVVAEDTDGFRAGLAAAAAGGSSTQVVRGTADLEGKTVFVFPGQGSQWAGMAAGLLDVDPVFTAQLERCAEALEPYVDWSLLAVLRGTPGAPSLERVDVVQPALWAVMISLAELWKSYGLRPSAVVGHSQGEIAAAYVAGALSLEDSARVVALRSKAILALAGTGGMASLALAPEAVAERITVWNTGRERISVAAVNGPAATVVAGEPEALQELVASCEAEGLRARLVQVDYASHSAQVGSIREELLAALADVAPLPSEVPLLSTVTADWLDTTAMTGDYWYTNLRQTVRFEEAARSLAEQGFDVFVEASAHPVLVSALQETLDSARPGAAVVGTLRRDQGTLERFHLSAAEAYVRGAGVDWAAVHRRRGGRRVPLPTYAFQRRRFWLDPTPGSVGSVGTAAASPGDLSSISETSGTAASDDLRPTLAALPTEERRRRLLDLVRTETALVLGHDEAGAIGGHKPFRDLGLDSLTAVDLRNRLGAAIGAQLPATLVFDYPSPDAVAGFLAEELADDSAAVRFPSAAASLDYLEAALASDAPDDDPERAALVARVRVLAERWAVRGAEPSGLDLDAATDQDLFDLLDQDLESF